MQLESTDRQPLKWRVWHSANYCTGSLFFFIGSILLFPNFETLFNSGLYSAWLYTIGSLTFSLADATEWAYYEPIVICNSKKCCLIPTLSFNFFLSMTGSILYLIGSAMFIPQINKINLGLFFFIIASIFIVISQGWKMSRVIVEGKKRGNLEATIKQDFNGVMFDMLAGLGSSMYCSGSFLFFDPRSLMQNFGSTIFTIGGILFCASSVFMIRRYFFKKKVNEQIVLVGKSQKRIDYTEHTQECCQID